MDFDAGKRVSKAMREANKAIMEICGEDFLVACYRYMSSVRMHENARAAGMSQLDQIIYGFYPYKSYKSILSETYRADAAYDIVYGQFDDFKNDIAAMSSHCMSDEEITAHITFLSSICQNLNMLNLSINLMSECFAIVSGKRSDLAEYIGV